MEVYSYEGKKANEVFEKALSDLNVTEDEILYHKQINKGGFLKSDTVKFTIIKLTEVQNAIKSFLEETINNMGLEVKFETNIREKQINIKIFSNNNSILIGRDGKNLTALSTICKQYIYNQIGVYPYLNLDVENYKDKQIEGFKRLGVLADWDHPYITYQPEMEAKQIEVFGEMYKKGYIYKGLKPVYWCTDCETALAEAEIEYKDVNSNTAYVKFPVIEGKGLFDERDTYIVIWTTTPWTLPGNVGITISPDFEYSLVDANGEKLIMATELVDKVMKIAGIDDYTTIKVYKGIELEGVRCRHPFLPRESRVVLGSEDTILVELGTGTGAVHTAPGYGKEDYLCGLKNGLDIVVTVDSKGHQTAEAGPFAGMYYAKSDKEIIKWLEENNLLLAKQTINHSYPHCWRCKKPIIYRATDQWFASSVQSNKLV